MIDPPWLPIPCAEPFLAKPELGPVTLACPVMEGECVRPVH